MNDTILEVIIIVLGAWAVAAAARTALRAPRLADRVNTLLNTATTALAAEATRILHTLKETKQRSFEDGYELGAADTRRTVPAPWPTGPLGRPELTVPTDCEIPLPDMLIAWIEAYDGHPVPEWQRADIIARYS